MLNHFIDPILFVLTFEKKKKCAPLFDLLLLLLAVIVSKWNNAFDRNFHFKNLLRHAKSALFGIVAIILFKHLDRPLVDFGTFLFYLMHDVKFTFLISNKKK